MAIRRILREELAARRALQLPSQNLYHKNVILWRLRFVTVASGKSGSGQGDEPYDRLGKVASRDTEFYEGGASGLLVGGEMCLLARRAA
jgi:hypothetical protein